jgi:hypothetical protein
MYHTEPERGNHIMPCAREILYEINNIIKKKWKNGNL